MRMWRIDPSLLCRQHLLGAHRELHTLVGSIRKGIRLGEYVTKGLVETSTIVEEHTLLVAEMKKRGYTHKTPLTYRDTLNLGKVDTVTNITELARRCPECRARIGEVQNGTR